MMKIEVVLYRAAEKPPSLSFLLAHLKEMKREGGIWHHRKPNQDFHGT